jgi:hypothetical protein
VSGHDPAHGLCRYARRDRGLDNQLLGLPRAPRDPDRGRRAFSRVGPMRRWLCGRARGVIDIRLSAEPLHRQRLGEHTCNIFALHLPSHLSPNSSTYGSVTPTSRAPSATGLPRRVVGADRYIATHEQRSALGRDGRQQIPRSRQEYREPDDQTPRRRADRTYRSHERTRCQVGEDRTADAVERALAGRRGEEHCTALEGPATVRISTPAPALSANRAGAVSIARHIVRKQKPSSRLAPTVCVGTRCTARSCIALRSRTPPWQQRIRPRSQDHYRLAHVSRCFSGSEPVSFQLLCTLMKNACGPYLSAGATTLPTMEGDLVRTTRGKWVTASPTRCPNGCPLTSSQVLVGHVACLGHGGGGHTSWHCRTCDAVVYGRHSTLAARRSKGLRRCGSRIDSHQQRWFTRQASFGQPRRRAPT